MYKQLLKDASLYSVSSFIGRGLSLITVPLYTRILSPADYGALDLLNTMTVFLPLLLYLALDQAVVRFYIDAKDELEKRRIASTVLLYNIFIFSLLMPLAWPFTGWIAEEWLAGQVDRATVVLVFANMWTQSIFVAGNNQLRYRFKSKQYALCHIGNVFVSVGFSVFFVVFMRWGVFGIFLGQAIGQLIFGLLAVYLGRRSYGLIFHWPSLRMMLAYSLPLVPATVSFYIMQYIDRVFINELKTLHDVGIYSIGARLAALVNLFLMGFHGAWSPMVMKTFREDGARERFKVIFNHYLFVTMMILAGLSLFSEEILLVLTTETFSAGYVVVPLLVLSAVLASIGGYFTFGIQIEKKSNYRLVTNVITAILNCILNFLLIPRFGIVGAALATASSYAFLAIVSMNISQRLYHVPYDWGRIATALLVGIGVSGWVILTDVPISLTGTIVKIIVVAGVMFALAMLLNIRPGQLLSRGIISRGRGD